MRIECPTCKTSYTAERLGLKLEPKQTAHVDVGCVLCKQAFSVTVIPREVTTVPGWWARVVLRRAPTTTIDGHEVR
jgi:phage FluMu protein Com